MLGPCSSASIEPVTRIAGVEFGRLTVSESTLNVIPGRRTIDSLQRDAYFHPKILRCYRHIHRYSNDRKLGSILLAQSWDRVIARRGRFTRKGDFLLSHLLCSADGTIAILVEMDKFVILIFD